MKRVSLIAMVVLFQVFLGFSCLWADTVSQTFSHKLSGNEASQSWEHKIDLPDNLSQQGFSFWKRTLTLSGKLEIEHEELTATYYYIKVHLAKSFWGSKGDAVVQLEAQKDAPPCNPIPTPTELTIPSNSEPTCPDFTWKGPGKYSAVSLYDVTSNQTVCERIIPGKNLFSMKEGRLSIDHHYKWGVKQSDECARYSPEAQAGFRLELHIVTCPTCHGMGWVTCTHCNGTGHIFQPGPNGQPIQVICGWCHGMGHVTCTDCNGTGRVKRPVIVVE
ncbi:MAG: hypothetical protein HQM08_13760 [Candidatus Riflebacteria bacterium]|nr:hypothetical protein [Candidatus Riflebacteria bacterium]